MAACIWPNSSRLRERSKRTYPRYHNMYTPMDAHSSAGQVFWAGAHFANAVSSNKGDTRQPRTSRTNLPIRQWTHSIKGSSPFAASQPQEDRPPRNRKSQLRSNLNSDYAPPEGAAPLERAQVVLIDRLYYGNNNKQTVGGGSTVVRGETVGNNSGPYGYRHCKQIHQNISGGRGAT